MSAPSAPAQNPVNPDSVPVQRPAQSTMIPIKTLQIKPPVSFSPDQLPQGGVIEFTLMGTANQFLLVRVKAGDAARVEVQRQQPNSPALEPGGDAAGTWLYALPETGLYRVLLDPGGDKPGIDFALLAADDPSVDPGIKPEQVTIDFGQFVQGDRLKVVPYAHFEGYIDESWPTHLAVEGKGFEFRIMSVAKYREVFQPDQSMDLLQEALQSGGKAVAVEKLPYPILPDEGFIMSARREFFKGEGWHGLRWIGGFGQDDTCRPDLAYFFRGMSDDGRYFVMIRAQISHPRTRQLWTQDCVADADAPKIDQQLGRDLDAAPPNSFHPSLDQLDAVIKSLRLLR